MEKEIILTKDGLQDLKNELKNLIEVTRPQVIEELVEARNQGDLSENADYDAARNRQAEVEARIKELEATIANAKLIEEDVSSNAVNSVHLGSEVVFENMKSKEKRTVKIVGPIEADPFQGRISNESPLAKAIMGRVVGDTTEVKDVVNPYRIKIVEVKN
jgi:transcription elongation factor GreA